jgi:hypothetical protein
MKWTPLIVFSSFLTLAFSSCGPTKPVKSKEDEKKPKTEPPKLVGKIASVPADKRFVLIQSYGKWDIEAGRILTTRGAENRTANLRVTGEALGEFAAADVQSGPVEAGDAVYSQHVAKPVPEPAPVEPPLPPENKPITELPKNN